MIQSFISQAYKASIFFRLPPYFESTIFNLLYRMFCIMKEYFLGFLKHSYIFGLFQNPIMRLIVFAQFIFFSIVLTPGYSLQPLSTVTPILTSSIVEYKSLVLTLLLFTLPIIPIIIIVFSMKSKIRKKYLKFLRFEFIMFLFLIPVLLSTNISIDQHISFLIFLQLFRAIFIYFILSRIELTSYDVWSLFAVFIGVIFLESILAILQFLHNGLLDIPLESINAGIISLPDEKGNSYFRPLGTLYHPNTLATYMNLLIPISIAITFSQSLNFRRLGYTTVFLGFITSFITFSRWGFIMELFGAIISYTLCIYWFKDVFKKRYTSHLILFFSIFVCLISLIITHPYLKDRYYSLLNLGRLETSEILKIVITPDGFNQAIPLELTTADKSFTGREKLISQALYVIRRFPLGIGMGVFPYYVLNYNYTESLFIASVHNFYLLATSEIGIMGILIFIFLCLEFFHIFEKTMPYLNSQGKLLGIVSLSSLAIFLTRSMWEASPFGGHITLIVWTLMAVFISIVRKENVYL